MAQHTIRADILGKLLMIQETLDILPDSAAIAAFLRRALGEIPGVTDMHLYMGGALFPPSREFEEFCADNEAAWTTSGACVDCTIGTTRAVCVPLRTARHPYGMLILSLDDEDSFSPYRAFVQNIANVVATTFEAREYVRQLDEARAGLEAQVAERTATLKESQEKFRALVETISDWVWEVDAGGAYTYASPRVEALLGFKPEEVVGKTPFDFMLPEEAQRAASSFLAASRAAKPLEQVLNTNLHKNGHAVVMETSGTPIFDALGNLAGYRGIDRDVTARQRDQEALRESENKFKQVSAGAQDAIIVMDQDGKITDWNASAEKMFGYAVAEVTGQDMHLLLAPARYYDVCRKGWQQFQKTGTGPVINKTLELTALGRDGVEFPVELSISSVELRGRWNAIGIVRDITERKQTEEVLTRRTTDLRERVKELECLFGVSRLIADPGKTLDQVFEETIRFIPPGWCYPEIACARIAFQDRVFTTDNFRETPWRLSADIVVSGKTGGTVEVGYLEERPASDEGPFLKEERTLINSLAEQLGTMVERKRTEQAEMEQFKLAETFFNHSLSCIVILDRDFNFIRVNQAYARECRKEIGDFTGRNHFEMYPSDAKSIFEEVVRTKRPYETFTKAFVYPDQPERGTTYWDWTLVPILDGAGEIEYLVFSLNDVTERKRAEEEQRAAALYARSLIEASLDPLVTISPEGKITDVNQMTEDVTGIARTALIGTDFADYFTEPEQARAGYRQVLAQGYVRDYPLTIRHGSGRTTDVLYNATVYRNEAGELQGVFAAARDITERKRGELALERANRALRTLSACNTTLVHVGNESELLDSICRIIVETGGYRMAWVGVPEQDPAKMVRAVAHYGHEEGYLAVAKFSWADTEIGRGPTGTAIRTGTVQVNQNFLANPQVAPWQEAARQRGYQSSIALPLKSSAGTFGVLTIYAPEPDAFDEGEVGLLRELAEDLAFGIETLRMRADRDRIAREHLHHAEMLKQSLQDSIKAIADTIEMRDSYTAGHQRRVGQLAVAISKELGLSEDAILGIGLAAGIHDLGKISVPAEILAKPSKLTDIEFMLIKSHAQAGYNILKDIKFPWPIANMVWQHHERLDGTGYPQGLKDGEILLESRIMAVADVVEAMASHRPYRAALGIDVALKEIERGRGMAYDPAVVDACLKLFREGRFAFLG